MTTISLSPTHNIFLDKSPLDCISSINIFIVHMIASLDQIILLHLVQNKCFICPLNQVSDESMWLCISACMCYTSAGLPFLVRSECLRQGAAAGLCRVSPQYASSLKRNRAPPRRSEIAMSTAGNSPAQNIPSHGQTFAFIVRQRQLKCFYWFSVEKKPYQEVNVRILTRPSATT